MRAALNPRLDELRCAGGGKPPEPGRFPRTGRCTECSQYKRVDRGRVVEHDAPGFTHKRLEAAGIRIRKASDYDWGTGRRRQTYWVDGPDGKLVGHVARPHRGERVKGRFHAYPATARRGYGSRVLAGFETVSTAAAALAIHHGFPV